MLIQRFVPVNPLLLSFRKTALRQFESWDDPLNLSFDEVDELIISEEDFLFRLLEQLSSLNDESTVNSYICRLPSEQAFALYVSIQAAFCHFHADAERLPLLPITQFLPLIFAYVQEGYKSFRRHCQAEGLSMWETIVEYEYDHGNE